MRCGGERVSTRNGPVPMAATGLPSPSKASGAGMTVVEWASSEGNAAKGALNATATASPSAKIRSIGAFPSTPGFSAARTRAATAASGRRADPL